MIDTADAFEGHRARLTRVAYRLTGSVADAEDAVQEAWLRLDRHGAEGIRDLGAWLTTTVSRLCLDRLTSAQARRETYVGTWLPEPVVTAVDGSAPDPLHAVIADEHARYAAMVVLEVLPPAQRVAFVLHDGFAVPFAEVADVLDVSPANARQLASRARTAVRTSPPPVSAVDHAAAVERLVTAVLSGDLDAVVAALHDDATFVGDANGRTPTARRMLLGPGEFARFALGLVRINTAESVAALRPVLVNGRLGLAHAGSDARHPARVTAFDVRNGRVIAAWDIANPDKLHGVRIDEWEPVEPG